MTSVEALIESGQARPRPRELEPELAQILDLADAVRTALKQLGLEDDRIKEIKMTPDGAVIHMYDDRWCTAVPNPSAPYHYDVQLLAA